MADAPGKTLKYEKVCTDFGIKNRVFKVVADGGKMFSKHLKKSLRKLINNFFVPKFRTLYLMLLRPKKKLT